MNHKSNPKPKRVQLHSIDQAVIAELMAKAKTAQLQRDQLIKAQHNRYTKTEFFPEEKTQNIHRPSQLVILPEINSIQSSFRPFESNRTLEPYLINIKEEYVCSRQFQKHQHLNKQQRSKLQSNDMQDKLPNPKHGKQNLTEPISNSESIQLSESRDVSEEMLLHNSVTSKFLESPTLSLGLVESKITKKEADSQNNSKVLRHKPAKSNKFQAGQVLFMSNATQQLQHKHSLKMYQQLLKNYQQENQMTIKKMQQRDASQQFPQQASIKENIKNQVENNQRPIMIDPEVGNSIMASYQMEVEYLRKVNLYQSLQIQKLRKLIRINQNNHQTQPFPQNQLYKAHPESANQQKTQFKKAIDIIKRRQTFNRQKRHTQLLSQLDTNLKNTSIDHTTDVEFICGDYSSQLNNKRSVSFTTNHLTTAESFHPKKTPVESFYPKKKTSTHQKRSHKSKTYKKPLSTIDQYNVSINCTDQNHPLNYKSQSLSMSTQQMMNGSMGRHNMSCSAYFMATKSTKKSGKAKKTHSERNLSTIVSLSNKQNAIPKMVKHEKKMGKKTSILSKEVDMFVGKKNSAQFGSMGKKIK